MLQFTSLQFSCSLQPHGLQHTRPPYPSLTPGVYSNSCPLSWQCHPTISSSVIPFSCLQFFPASGSFPMSQFSAAGGQSIGVSASASVLSMNIQVFTCLQIWTETYTTEFSQLSGLWPQTGTISLALLPADYRSCNFSAFATAQADSF